MDLIIKDALIVTVNAHSDIIDKGSILVENGQIKEIIQGDLPSEIKAGQIIDAKGCLVMPGWVNTHTHAAMSIYRGLADDLPLMEWLEKHIWPAEAKFGNEENVRLGTQLAVLEMMQSGTTCFSDMYFFQDAVADECEKAGMRVVLGEGVLDFPTPSIKNPEESFQYIEDLILKWKDHDLISLAVSPHAPYTVSKERLVKAKDLARKYDLLFHTHLSETAFEVEQSKQMHRMSPVEYLNSIGILDNKTVSAHCVHLSDKDMEIIAETGMGVSHNPQSNMKLASGVAPVQKMLDLGIRVGIGTDGTASNNNLNMFEEADMASKIAKVQENDATHLDAKTVVEMGTIRGAEILGLSDKVGSIEIGKMADLQIIDLNYPRLQPMYNPYSHIVYAMNGSEVRDLIINGKIVMRDRDVLNIDQSQVIEKTKKLGLAIQNH